MNLRKLEARVIDANNWQVPLICQDRSPALHVAPSLIAVLLMVVEA